MVNKLEDIKEDLLEAVFQVLNPSLAKEEQGEVTEVMNQRGYNMGWNAIRYALRTS